MKNSWLLLLKTEKRVHAGNLGYDDKDSSSYSWDNTVPNHNEPSAGDRIVIWDGETSLGTSVIERIKTGVDKKIRRRCPNCSSTNIRERTSSLPKFKCAAKKCLKEFVQPKDISIQVKTFKTCHESGWLDLSGRFDAKLLRKLCQSDVSQHSIRPFKWDEFLEVLDRSEKNKIQTNSRTVDSWLGGGRKYKSTKVRIGQRKFRQNLIDKFGNVCAFMGETPLQALEAAHLYSFADIEKHFDCGGILLRRDLHRLFDLGLIAVNPTSLMIDLSPEIKRFAQYNSLHNKLLSIKLSKKEVDWLKIHWNEHRK